MNEKNVQIKKAENGFIIVFEHETGYRQFVYTFLTDALMALVDHFANPKDHIVIDRTPLPF